MRHVRQLDTTPGRVPTRRRRPILLPVLLSVTVALVAVTIAVSIFGPASAVDDDPSLPGAQPGPAPSTATATALPESAENPAPARFGVFVGTDSAAAQEFQEWLGRPVQDVLDFSARESWSDIANPSYLLAQWKGTKRRLIYGVPMLPDALAATKETAMRDGAKGSYDKHFRELAQRLVAGGHENAVLRIGWEFNITTWAWGIKDHDVFVAYFRRVVKAMRSVPGQKFNINWNPNNGYNPYNAVNYYPGDAFVDSIGVDAYDVDKNRYPYPKKCNQVCREQRQETAWREVIFGGPQGLDFWAYFSAQHNKPFSLPEWSMWDRYDGTGGGDNPYFLQQMKFFIAAPQHRVSFAVYFNRDSGDGRHNLLETFPVGSKRFRELFGR